MNEPTIGRLLGLVEKTGDKVIVTDPAGEHPYVLMSLDQYERLVGNSAKPVGEKPAPARTEVPAHRAEMPAAPKPMPQSAPKPMNVQGFAKPADLWRAKLGLDVVEPQPRDLFKPQANNKPKPPAPPPMVEAQFEVEGEEQFYMEPLE
jgi:hypothetical protein